MSASADARFAALARALAAGASPVPFSAPGRDRGGVAALWERLDAAGTTRLELTRCGLVRAADRVHEEADDAIQYDAVWVRDAAWGALALLATPGRRADGGRVVRELLRSFATPVQRARFDAVIRDPAIAAANHPEAGMNVVHIRFDGRSPTYEDVVVDGRVQGWNHKQNDALGLFLVALVEAAAARAIDPEDFAPAEWQALVRFAPYFAAIAYDTCEDAGAWEEIERLNTSSVGLVAAALERLADGLAAADTPLFALWRRQLAAESGNIAAANEPAALRAATARGLARVRRQLPGGESPDYPPDSSRFRAADAALLNLVAPAPLAGLSLAERRLAVAHVQTLVRPMGVLRYVGDTYQAANAWFLPPWEVAADAARALERSRPAGDATRADADTASGRAFLERARGFVPGTEARWFFDSWLALAHVRLYEAAGDPDDLAAGWRSLERAIAQITPSPAPLGADGRRGQALALPESYNTIVLPDGSRHLVPSPVMPLNWAKASLALALAALAAVAPAGF